MSGQRIGKVKNVGAVPTADLLQQYIEIPSDGNHVTLFMYQDGGSQYISVRKQDGTFKRLSVS